MRKKSYENMYPVEEDWVKSRWRPAMAWTYMAIIIFDFILGPIATMLFYHITGGDYVPWVTLTLGEGGLFHMAMGAILGVAAWTRGQEKVKRLAVGEQYDEDTPRRKRRTSSDRRPEEDTPVLD